MKDNKGTNEKAEGLLCLEDGTVFRGKTFGHKATAVGELVFNTAMTGYQEMLTDPAYKGQIITMTYPIAGSYGVNSTDSESEGIHAFGLIIHDLCDRPSHSDSEKTLDQWLKEEKIPGIYGLDTRKITRKIRNQGTIKCLISTEGISISRAREIFDEAEIRGDWMKTAGVGKKTIIEPEDPGASRSRTDVSGSKTAGSKGQTESIPGEEDTAGEPLNVAVLDFGAKKSTLRPLSERNCRLTLYPYGTSAQEILADEPDGVFLTSGPGDPQEASEAIEEVRKLIAESDLPMFGTGMGHQILALALGGSTYKMKYGHRGGNHGVFDKSTKRSYVTSQNHGYEVRYDSIILKGMDVTHLNLNDGAVEGMEHRDAPIFSVQFYPDSCSGTGDSNYLYDRFVGSMAEAREDDAPAKATEGGEL